MKKYLFILLLTIAGYGQTYQNPTFGTVTSKTNVEDNSAEKILVQNSLGKFNWIYKNSLIPDNFTKVVYVNNNNPNSATIFDLNNPPVTNDNLLKSDVNNLYIGADASTWVYNATTVNYVTKTVTSNTSNFYLAGTTTDAGNNKTAAIVRNGSIQATSFIRTGATATNALLAGGSTLANPVSGTGTSGQVSFWNGTGTQTGDNGLFWDDTNKRLGIGTTSPIGKLTIATGTSPTTSISAQVSGTVSMSNGGTGVPLPVISSKSDSSIGMCLIGATADIHTGSTDFQINVRETDNTDFTTLTSSAFKFSRFSTTLVDILRNGNTTFTGNISAPLFTGSASLTGNPTAPTPTAGDNDTSIATTAFVTTADNLKANIASPTFTGNPTAPTPTAGDNDTSIPTTAFVTGAIATATGVSGFFTPTGSGLSSATFLKSYYFKKGNILTMYINISLVPSSANMSSTGSVTLPNSYTIANKSAGRVVGSGALSCSGNASSSAVVAKEPVVSNTALDLAMGNDTFLTSITYYCTLVVCVEVN